MPFLLLNQFFYPDAAATSQLLTDVARHLSAEGAEVTAVCSAGAYAAGGGENLPGVCILRVPALPFARGHFQRLASYLSFFVGAAWYGLRAAPGTTVVSLTTPPLLSLIGTLLQKTRGARHLIWEMDVYPGIAVDLGVLHRTSIITRILAAAANYSRRRADAIIALGPCMRDRLIASGVPAEKIQIAQNWAHGSALPASPARAAGPLRILYSGNLGLAHDTETIFAAMCALKADARFQFVFAGHGPLRPVFERLCSHADLRHVEFLPFSSKSGLAANLASADIGLVTQRASTCGSVVPSKIYGIMAVARPLLFIGPAAATVARNIQQHRCGWQVEPGDAAELISTLRRLAADRQEVHTAGANARAAFEAEYDLPAGVERICGIIRSIAAAPQPESIWRFGRPPLTRALLSVWVLAIIGVAMGTLLPGNVVSRIAPATGGFDKVEHMAAYALLVALPCVIFSAIRVRILAACAMLCLGGGLELLQALTPDRSPDLLDMCANGVGVLAGFFFPGPFLSLVVAIRRGPVTSVSKPVSE